MQNRLLITLAGNKQIKKPESLSVYQELNHGLKRAYLTPLQFAEHIACGQAWFGCVFSKLEEDVSNSHTKAWQHQSLIALDFDKAPASYTMPDAVLDADDAGLHPLIAHETFGHSGYQPRFRLIWQVESILLAKHGPWIELGKRLNEQVFHGYADKHAISPLKLWQGTNKRVYCFDRDAKILQLDTLA